jgi:Second Messenger Oligonucleotide or Dinucleotide Synthetase domain
VATTKNITTLADQFDGALSRLELSKKRARVEAAHTEIRELLERDEQLCAWGVDTVLIGSYARKTAIYPGKDVDVFTKLTELNTGSIEPKVVFEAVRDVLVEEYEDRAKPQNRSITVAFPTDDDEEDFHVDVVPAVHHGVRWAIPRRDTSLWESSEVERRWVETDPEKLTGLTQEQNESPKVAGRGAYVPTAKLVRQVRRHHRGKAKPSGFYFELMTYWTFEAGVEGDSFAEIVANTLTAIAAQLRGGVPVIDPVLGKSYKPAPDAGDLLSTVTLFTGLAEDAQRALTLDKCQAAVIWRRIIGEVDDFGPIFEIPPGCDEEGQKLPATAVRARGGEEANRFATSRNS